MDKPVRRSTRIKHCTNDSESSPEQAAGKDHCRARKDILKTPKSKTDEQQVSTPKTQDREKRIRRNETEVTASFSPKKLRGNRTPSAKALESIVSENSPTLEKLDSPMRRSLRQRTPNVKNQRYSDINLKIDLKNKVVRSAKKSNVSAVIISSESESEDDSENQENLHRPTTLFDESEDVEGQKLYSFKTPKKKDGMAALASNTPKTPRHHDPNKTPHKTPIRLSMIQKTPTSRPSAGKCVKTPRHIRDEIKKKLHKLDLNSQSESDLSASESDYNPELSSSESEEENDAEIKIATPPKKSLSVASRLLKTPSVAASQAMGTRRSARNKTDYNYILQSDDYFSTQTSKIKTSDHTLDRLKNPRLPHDQLIKLLSNMQLSTEHESAIKGLHEEYKRHFDKWLTLFDEGFTVLLHGLGSKRNLLQAFHKEKLFDQHVLVINGFFPSLTIKDILDSIAVDMLEMTSTSSNPHKIVSMIQEEMKEIPAMHLFLIIHNIDGTMLRNEKSQSVLSRLATIPGIHMIASIDHINAPLLWNNTKLSHYNFSWWDVTSFLPYTEETAYENSLLSQRSDVMELSSMKSVFQSLTSNARGIYILLIKYQLKNSRNPNYQGMTFKELYGSCREAFLVSSDVALRAQLTEFLDHKLAKLKRIADGSEHITIPIKNVLLEQFLSEQN